MKKLLLLMVAALSIMFTQCKKTEVSPSTPVTPAAEGGVNITLSVDGGSNGSRVDVNTVSGVVNFEYDDVIYVASDGKYVGTLSYNGTKFTGTITNPKEGEPLYFYFLGNKTLVTTPVVGSTTEIAVSIADQGTKFPVISAAASNQNYSSGTTNYSATLMNKCGLVKFIAPSGYIGSGSIIIKGMNNKVTVSFSNSGIGLFSFSKVDNGAIKLNKVGNDYWAILLPQDAVNGGAVNSSDGWCGTFGNVPAIQENCFETGGVGMTLSLPQFTVANGRKVRFSAGLMYWDGDSFEFELDQTSYQPSANGSWNTNHVNHFFFSRDSRVSYAITHDGANEAYGITTSGSDVLFTNNQDIDDYAKPNSAFTVNGETGVWRTLTSPEYVYLLNTDNNQEGARTQVNRFAKAKVNGLLGLLIFPDGYNSGVEVTGVTGIAAVDNGEVDFPDVSIADATWTEMQAAGVVFLPAGGSRFSGEITSCGTYGSYWSSTPNNSNNAIRMDFNSGRVASLRYNYRHFGYFLRLVR